MDDSYHYLLMSNHLLLQKKLFSLLKSTGLSVGQPKVLDFLKDHNGVTQKEIALGCHIEPASLTSVLNRMERQQLIQRRVQNGNRRSFYIFLTEKGGNFIKTIEEAFNLLEAQAFQGIPEKERLQFMEILFKIYKNMTEE